MNQTKLKFDLSSKRQVLLIGIALVLSIGIFFVPAIPQDQAYHQFADNNTFLSIPNFWNVVSNLPFILVGIIGLVAIRKQNVQGGLEALSANYNIFFIGLVFTGFGSSYYHWNPNNTSLVWDRLPMTISFMAFFTAIMGEHISLKLSKRSLYPFLILGFLSVLYWFITEQNGNGDLRPYALVQFLPVILIPLILWLYPSPFERNYYIIMVLLSYALAKFFEHFDKVIYEILIVISGHSIKHLVAALGTYFYYLALKKRRLIKSR